MESEQQIEDVIPVEEITEDTQTNEETGLTAQEEKFLRSAVINKYRYHLREIYKYLRRNKITLEDVINQINNKTCRLSSTQRDFVMSFKPEFIQALLNDMFGE